MLKALSMLTFSHLAAYLNFCYLSFLFTPSGTESWSWLIDILIYSIAVPVATFMMAVLCGTDKLRCDLLLNMLLVSFGVVISSYGEIHFNVVGTVYQVTGIVAEALRLVLTQVLLQKKGLTLNPITSLYYIAPCRYSSSIHEKLHTECSLLFSDLSIFRANHDTENSGVWHLQHHC